MSSCEKKITDFLKKHYAGIFLIFAFILGCRLRWSGVYMVSDDFSEYLKSWYDTFKENTGFKGLVLDCYNYYIPYVSIIAFATYFENLDLLLFLKAISVFFELICAIFASLCAYVLLRGNEKRKVIPSFVFAVMWLSPTAMMNGAYWAQCDYIYIAFLMVSIYLMLEEHPDLSLVFFGIAFTFKLQAVFLLPAYGLYYLQSRKFSIVKFLYIPLCYIIGGLPAIIEGKSAADTYGIYLNQSHGFGQLSMNAPNLYRFFSNEGYNEFYRWGIGITAVIFLILGFIVVYHNYKIDNEAFLLMCAISAGICFMFLPEMHERYSALFIVLSYLYFAVYKVREIGKAIILDFIAMITYFYCLYGFDMVDKYRILAIINFVILLDMIKSALVLLRKKGMEAE